VTNIEPGREEPAPREVGKPANVEIRALINGELFAEICTERPSEGEARAYVAQLLPQIEALIRGDGPYLQ
jgi:hypothetical protein